MVAMKNKNNETGIDVDGETNIGLIDAVSNSLAAMDEHYSVPDTESTALSSMQDSVADFGSARSVGYTSIKGDDFESKLASSAAASNSVNLRDEALGKTINLRNFIIQIVEIADEETGELIPTYRCILIDEDGSSYHATSRGIFQALRSLVGQVGEPATWARAIPVKAVEEKTRRNWRVLTLKIAL